MTPNQFTKALVQLGVSQIQLATALKINERTVRSWVGGRSAVPNTIAALLNLMRDTGKTLSDLRV